MGFFELVGIPAGKSRFLASDRDAELFADTKLEIVKGEDAFWEATLGPPKSLLVRVQDASGAPVQRAMANLLLNEEAAWGEVIQVDERGEARFPHVPALPIALAVKRAGAGTQPHGFLEIEEYGEVEIVLPERSLTTSSLRGVLLDDSGLPFSSAVVVGCAPPGGMFEVRVNEISGAFEVRVEHADDYELWAFADGAGYIDLGNADLSDSSHVELQAIQAPPTQRVDIDWSGSEVPTSEAPWFVETGGLCKRIDGTRILILAEPLSSIRLLPGPYRLRAAKDPNLPFEPEFEVRPGETLAIRPRLAQ